MNFNDLSNEQKELVNDAIISLSWFESAQHSEIIKKETANKIMKCLENNIDNDIIYKEYHKYKNEKLTKSDHYQSFFSYKDLLNGTT